MHPLADVVRRLIGSVSFIRLVHSRLTTVLTLSVVMAEMGRVFSVSLTTTGYSLVVIHEFMKASLTLERVGLVGFGFHRLNA